jgi:hypothetical protein
MQGAILDAEAPLDRDALDHALGYAGVRVLALREERGTLPLL